MSRQGPFVKDPSSAKDYPFEAIAEHIGEERKKISLLGEIREIVFGAQDGLVSTLAVVAAVAGATNDQLSILIAGIAAAMAGVFSMAIGEYMGSKSQSEIFEWHIDDEREEIRERPLEAEAELAYMFTEEGMPIEDAYRSAALIAQHPEALLSTMVSKELGLAYDSQDETEGGPLRGALFMGGSFALGALPPVVPFLFVEGIAGLAWATALSGLSLFALGAFKSQWTHRSWLSSGLEILSLAAVAGVAGYLFGSMLPGLLGIAIP